jgi:hypothetical protein
MSDAPERIQDTSQSAEPATTAVPPGHLKGDAAQETLSRFQRLSLVLSGIALVIKRYIRSRLALSPVMRRRLETKGEWFSPYLQEVLGESASNNNSKED